MNSNIAQWMCRRVFIRMWSRTWCIGLIIQRARRRLSLVVGGLLLLSYMNREKGTRDLMSMLPSSQAVVTSVLMCRRSEWSSFNEHFPRVIAQTYLFDYAIKDQDTVSLAETYLWRRQINSSPYLNVSLILADQSSPPAENSKAMTKRKDYWPTTLSSPTNVNGPSHISTRYSPAHPPCQ